MRYFTHPSTMIALTFLLQDELQCLKEFYTLTNGANWIQQNGWKDGTDMCKFFGVTCDDKKSIQELSLAGNNLTGVIPDCFYNLSGLTDLDLHGNDFKNQPFDTTILKQVIYLNLQGCHFKAQNSPMKIGGQINIAYNDFSNITIELQDIATVTRLELTGTEIKGNIALDQLQGATDISVGGTNLILSLNGKLGPKLNTIDITNATLAQTWQNISQDIITSNIEILGMANCSLQGFAPNFSEIHNSKIIHYTFENNPFLCDFDTDRVTKCTFANINSTQVNKSNVNITVLTQEKLRPLTNDVVNKLEIHVKDVAKSSKNHTETIIIPCVKSSIKNIITFQCNCTICEGLAPTEYAITYNNVSVSTGSLLYEQIIKQKLNLLQRIQKTEDSTEFVDVDWKDQQQYNHQDQLQKIKAQKNKYLIDFEVTAYSKCPDYVSVFYNLYSDFMMKYPEIAKYINLIYKSMASSSQLHTVTASSMHGQLEAYIDLLYLCHQKIHPESFIAGQVCFNLKKNNKNCLHQAVNNIEIEHDIKLCAVSDEGKRIMVEHQKWIKEHQTTWSPTFYINGKNICLWHYHEREGDCIFIFDTIDDFAKYMCGQKKLKDTPECKQLA